MTLERAVPGVSHPAAGVGWRFSGCAAVSGGAIGAPSREEGAGGRLRGVAFRPRGVEEKHSGAARIPDGRSARRGSRGGSGFGRGSGKVKGSPDLPRVTRAPPSPGLPRHFVGEMFTFGPGFFLGKRGRWSADPGGPGSRRLRAGRARNERGVSSDAPSFTGPVCPAIPPTGHSPLPPSQVSVPRRRCSAIPDAARVHCFLPTRGTRARCQP
ncbi:conserved hypothetical protein [Ixodes scapularis]|uniref:Uncharacterized protein n=1 Tax=Ixodes scapularis TaxID=6945 RepID=B7QJA3_IXOSC|nr:conserved hypothetical protein [Ixodes scapularis]|eukprot:XP_002415260.1 conserved hypothetical protein [Ixodes scapularis]